MKLASVGNHRRSVMNYADFAKRSLVYDLAQVLGQETPMGPTSTPFRVALTLRHGDLVRSGGITVSNELISLGGHTGTHIDALCHVGRDGKLHGGFDAHKASVGGRFAHHGVETIAPIVCRGILLDVAKALDADCLDPRKPITRQDLETTCSVQGVEVRSGDAVLIHTGWARTHYHAQDSFLGWQTGVPGPNEDAARWLSERGIRLTGSDTIAYEWIEPGAGHSKIPVHAHLLVDCGIHIVEVLKLDELASARVYEFLFVLAPPKLEGASSAPVRPIAIVAGE
jgi:kynurenine formamidase